MANSCFQLQRSYFALCFQLLLASVIIALLAVTLKPWLVVVIIILLLVSYLHFFHQAKIIQLEYLSDQEWTLTNQQQQTQRQKIHKIIDHGIYVIIFFEQHAPLAIWCDQLDWQDWKRLKVLAKLY